MNLIYNGKCIPLTTDHPLMLGRNALLEITDERISRQQVSVSYNDTKQEFQVCSKNANVTLNGIVLKPQEAISIHDQDKLCLYKDSYCITFVLSEGTATPQLCDSDQDMSVKSEISEESSDIYDFEGYRI
jgi:hypothetical protein